MDMLNSRQDLMLKKLSYTWMVLKLMGMLLEQSSHCLRGRRFHHPQRLLPLLQREMAQKLIMLVQMLIRMDQSGREKLLPVGNLLLHHEGDPLLQVDEVDLQDDS